jgi:ribosomal protein S27AE
MAPRIGRPPSCECGDCGKCKRRALARARYQGMTMEERREWIARRDAEKVRAADRARYYRHHEERKARNREYRQQYPEKFIASARRWAIRNPEKRMAQNAVNNALRDGRLTKPMFCEQCSASPVQAHHDNYSKPLEVRWLCVDCHGIAHRKVA